MPRKCRLSTCATCSTPIGAGHGEVDRLAARFGQRVERGPRELDEVALEHAALGDAQDRRAGTQPARAGPSCSTSPRRSSAPTRREAVLLGMPAADASSVSATGCSLSSTRTSSSAPRSTAVRAVAPDELGTVVPRRLYYGDRARRRQGVAPRRSACSSTPCRATRSSARRRWTSSTAAGGGSSPSSGSSSCSRRRSRCCAPPGQIVEDENRVRFDPEFILEQVAKAPREFELQARNPEQTAAHRRRPHGVRARLRLPVHPRGRRPPRREDGRLREPRPARAVLRRARLARAARSASPRTARSTRATSTWCSRCRRCPTSLTWARSPPARTPPTRSGWGRSCSAGARRSSGRRCRSR